jgi:hypothetical protein
MAITRKLDTRAGGPPNPERGTGPVGQSTPTKRMAQTSSSAVEKLGKLEQRLNMLTKRLTEVEGKTEELWMHIAGDESEDASGDPDEE